MDSTAREEALTFDNLSRKSNPFKRLHIDQIQNLHSHHAKTQDQRTGPTVTKNSLSQKLLLDKHQHVSSPLKSSTVVTPRKAGAPGKSIESFEMAGDEYSEQF